MNERYASRGGEELLLRHGAGSPVTLLILPALFEEASRMRRFTVSLMRGLGARGIGSALPDLPGTGESLEALEAVSFEDWQGAAGSVADAIRAREGRCLSVAIRGGALLDGVADHRWRLAPETGERLLRDLVRATALTGRLSAKDIDGAARTTATLLAGNRLSPAMYLALVGATLPEIAARTVRIEGDAAEADALLTGDRLWRAAEPGDDSAMATAAVDDIATWVNACVG